MTNTALPPDPLQSPTWSDMARRFLADAPVVFDDRIKIGLPPVTEDQSQVPIMVDARALGHVERLAVIGDLNPFPLTLQMTPKGTPAVIGFRMRIEQGTVIRAAALKDGQWRVAGLYLDASGGGCTAPPSAEAKIDWGQIGHMRGRIWRESPELMRVRLRITHPMDTGLLKDPAFYIQSVSLKDAAGAPLADLEVHEGVAMNPTFTVLVAAPKEGDHIKVHARDIDGGSFDAKLPLPPASATDHSFREGRL